MSDNTKKIRTSEHDGETTVSLIGEIDLYDAPELESELKRVVQLGGTVTVDLRQAEFIDSAVMSCLLMAAKRLAVSGKRLKVLLHGKSHPAHVIQEVGFHSVMDLELEGPPSSNG